MGWGSTAEKIRLYSAVMLESSVGWVGVKF